MNNHQERLAEIELENSLFACRGLALSFIHDLIAENQWLGEFKENVRTAVTLSPIALIAGCSREKIKGYNSAQKDIQCLFDKEG